MPSTLTWLDHDAAERERMNRVLALFQERGTLDELGLGAIRDSISDQLFPGTSTIQTRLRYFLFVAWTYRMLEEKGTTSQQVAAKARQLELRVARPLLSTDESGIFGRMAGDNLKRLPSGVYWGGLGAWGIRKFNGSQDQYHRSLDRIYELRRLMKSKREGREDADTRIVTWHAALPPIPDGFPDEVSIELDRVDAEFLLDRIRASHPHSFLRVLAETTDLHDVYFPWEIADVRGMSDRHRLLLNHARLFSDLRHGATILYNLMLAEHVGNHELAEKHRAALDEWYASADQAGFRTWDLHDFWNNVVGHGHSITPAARDFVQSWHVLVVRSNGRLDVAEPRRLVENRERLTKGSRSKFTNRRVVEEHWQGYAGMFPLDYRWFRVRGMIADLHAGLGR